MSGSYIRAMSGYSIAIHGGAGTISRKNMGVDKESAYLAALEAALSAGEEILKEGGSALDAVIASVMVMEDDPKFNAGKGAVPRCKSNIYTIGY